MIGLLTFEMSVAKLVIESHLNVPIMSQQDSKSIVTDELAEKVTGCLVGLAVGDALGAPLEFSSRNSVRKRFPMRLRDMIASSLWAKGEYTDDTQMALLLAESLLQDRGLMSSDLARRFRAWARTAKDVGTQTRAVVNMHGYEHNPESCASRYFADHPDSSAGNGALMRCAPAALFCLNSAERLIETTRASARVTHADPRAESSCVLLNLWIRTAISRNVKDGRQDAIAFLGEGDRCVWQRLEHIEGCNEDEILSSGYTVHTLEAAAWSFLTTESYEDAVVRAANLGDDADTVAAVCGALAGAYYGYSAIPRRWLDVLKDEDRIRELALSLAARNYDATSNTIEKRK